MADAFKCDRCGDFCEGGPAFKIDKQTWRMDNGPSGLRNYQSPEFCRVCAREYEDWMRTVHRPARST